MPDADNFFNRILKDYAAQRASTAAPAPRHKVSIFGFRGKRECRGQSDLDGRLGFGHYGIRFGGYREIYGFNPAKPDGMSDADFHRALRANTSFPGLVTPDLGVFIQARDVFGIEIFHFTSESDEADFERAREAVLADVEESRRAPLASKRYMFPRPGSGFDAGCYNCATYFESIGVASPCPGGQLSKYLPPPTP